MYAPDAIALPDRVQHSSAASTDHTTKDRVDAIQVRLRGMRNEILAAAGIGSRERHADGARLITDGVDLIADRETGPAPTVAPRITVLHHEVRHHAMPTRAVEKATVDQVDERRDGEGCFGGQQLDVERAAVRLQEDMRVRTRQRRRQPAPRSEERRV